MKTIVFNLATGEESNYTNEESTVSNLISHFIIKEKGSLQLCNTTLRQKLRNKVLEGRYSYGLGDYAVYKK